MRKKFITALLMLCILLLPTPAAAATYTVSLETIDSIVRGNSSFAEESREKIRSQQNRNWKIQSEINGVSAKLSGLDEEDPEYESLKETYLSELQGLFSQKRQGEFDLKLLLLSENGSLAEQGQTGKEAYLKYWTLTGELTELKQKVAEAEKHLVITEKRYKRGVISKNTWKEEMDSVEDLCDQVPEVEDSITAQMDSLRESLGLEEGSTLELVPLNAEAEAGFNQAKDYSLEDDLKKVFLNSLELKKAQERVEFYRYQYDSRESYNQAVKDLATLRTKISRGFKGQYSELQKSIQKIEKTNGKKIKRALSKKKLMWKKYKGGVTARNEYLQAKKEYLEALRNKEKEMQALFPAILRYNLAVNGY